MTKSLSEALVEDIRSCNDQRQRWISLHKEMNNYQKKVWVFGAKRRCYSQIHRISFLLLRCFEANIISFWVKTEKKITWYSTIPCLETWQFCHQRKDERCHYSWKRIRKLLYSSQARRLAWQTRWLRIQSSIPFAD